MGTSCTPVLGYRRLFCMGKHTVGFVQAIDSMHGQVASHRASCARSVPVFRHQHQGSTAAPPGNCAVESGMMGSPSFSRLALGPFRSFSPRLTLKPNFLVWSCPRHVFQTLGDNQASGLECLLNTQSWLVRCSFFKAGLDEPSIPVPLSECLPPSSVLAI